MKDTSTVDFTSDVQRLQSYFAEIGMEQELVEKMVKAAMFKTYTAGEQILESGDRSEDICLITKGLVRGYYLDSMGNDITKCFSEEKDWCCSYNFLTDEASPFYIEAIEETTVARYNIEQTREIMKANSRIQETVDRLIREAFVESERRILSFAGMEAKERYLSFVAKRPQVAKRAKHEYIASYLGITPSSLSRIKKFL